MERVRPLGENEDIEFRMFRVQHGARARKLGKLICIEQSEWEDPGLSGNVKMEIEKVNPYKTMRM